METEWTVVEGTGWIGMPGFGRINPRQDNVGGGRQFFDAMLEDGTYATAIGDEISQGPETYHFEFDMPFLLADHTRNLCVEVRISLLVGGKYGVQYRPAVWPEAEGAIGGWA